MPAEVRLPQEGMSMTEGEVIEWHKAVGDTVAKGEVIAEVESEKSTFLIEAPADGTLVSIVVPAGERVPVRTVLALIAAPGETLEAAPASSGPTSSTAGPDAVAGNGNTTRHPSTPAQVTPAARKLASDHQIDLLTVHGSGPNGRILPEDVQNLIDSALETSLASETIPLEGVRGVIARRMLTSQRTMAQMTLVADADVTELVAQRQRLTASMPATYTHLIIRAAALALRVHPRLNATSDDRAIYLATDINIGFAVQHDDRLVVPVLRQADRRNLAGIVDDSAALVDAIRSGTARADIYDRGTFTVSNLGRYGIDAFTPIINPPQVAILGCGRIVERPARVEGNLAWRQFVTLSLTVDHRVVDGAPAADFLDAVVSQLQDPGPLFEP